MNSAAFIILHLTKVKKLDSQRLNNAELLGTHQDRTAGSLGI